ncbi:MAG: hypothetical protein U9N59_14650 [Campylobacterota bacterium]|nr:hypothetical protein [Campylobacterota bacterium]
MEELIVSNEELKSLFKDKILKDTTSGWYYKDTEIDIIAIHTRETKHITDVTFAENYKLKKKENNYR